MMTPYPRYKAPSLDPHKVLMLNQLFSRGNVWETPFGLGKARWEFMASAPAFTPACSVEFTLGNAAWTAYISDASCGICERKRIRKAFGYGSRGCCVKLQKLGYKCAEGER